MDELKEELREKIRKELPAAKVSFEPIELVDKIMSQGSATPIEVTVAAKDLKEAGRFAGKIQDEMKRITLLGDVKIAQPLAYGHDGHTQRHPSQKYRISSQGV